MKAFLISALLLFGVSGTPVRARTHRNGDVSGAIARSAAYDRAIRDAAARNAVDPRLIWTIAYLESRFRPGLVSPKGARGMMQFMPATGRTYGLLSRRDLHDPVRSIEAAAKYVSYLNKLFPERIDLILAAYNAGENSVISSGYRVPHYRETRGYVSRGRSLLARMPSPKMFSFEPIQQTQATLRDKQGLPGTDTN
ncbi:MAG: lytic transglycosylase domain-containing protein, partial [Blastocatellia bacterium]